MNAVCLPPFRLVAFTTTIASLGTFGLLTGCEDAEIPASKLASSPAAPSKALDAAIIQGDDQSVYAHIAAGTPINTKSMTGDTPLHIAAALGRAHAVEALIGAGAELEATNASGVTPLFNAAFFGRTEVLQQLIDAGAHTSVTDQAGTPIVTIMEMPWEQIRPIYEMVYSSIGLPFDAQRIKGARPRVAEMLR